MAAAAARISGVENTHLLSNVRTNGCIELEHRTDQDETTINWTSWWFTCKYVACKAIIVSFSRRVLNHLLYWGCAFSSIMAINRLSSANRLSIAGGNVQSINCTIRRYDVITIRRRANISAKTLFCVSEWLSATGTSFKRQIFFPWRTLRTMCGSSSDFIWRVKLSRPQPRKSLADTI